MSQKVRNRFFHLSYMGTDTPKEIHADLNDDWFAPTLKDLEEEIDDDEKDIDGHKSNLLFKGHIEKKSNAHLSEHFVLTGEVTAAFYTRCISTGEAMSDSVVTEVKAIFVDQQVCDKYGYEEEIEMSVEDDVFDLYFFENDQIDIYPVLHEYIFLNKNQYPKKSAQK